MKKVGYIDYYLDEWHANSYVDWIREASGGDVQVAYAYGHITSPITGMTTEQWCEKYHVEKCDTMEELIEKSDYLIVLSPDNCEMHVELSELALRSGKPAFVDKTFADSKAEAEQIFSFARDSKVFSSSALRFSEKLVPVVREDIRSVISTGGGRPGNYIIHQLEPIAVLMGTDVEKVIYTGNGCNESWTLRFADGRTAFINMIPGGAFQTKVIHAQSSETVDIDDDFFGHFIVELLKYFAGGPEPVCRQDTVRIMAIRETCLKAMQQPDQWLDVV